MLTITVAQDGSGDFSTISEAVLAAPYDLETLVLVGPGEYRGRNLSAKNAASPCGAQGRRPPAWSGRTAASCPIRTAAPPIPSAVIPPFSPGRWSR